MSVILTSSLEWTKFGDAGDDEAPCGAASGVNEMYADREQLACVRLMTEQRRGRGAQKVERALYAAQIIAKRRNPCVITHRSAGTRAQKAASLRRVPPLFSPKHHRTSGLYPLSAITPFTMARLWRN